MKLMVAREIQEGPIFTMFMVTLDAVKCRTCNARLRGQPTDASNVTFQIVLVAHRPVYAHKWGL